VDGRNGRSISKVIPRRNGLKEVGTSLLIKGNSMKSVLRDPWALKRPYVDPPARRTEPLMKTNIRYN
jgi:hypothetical protein